MTGLGWGREAARLSISLCGVGGFGGGGGLIMIWNSSQEILHITSYKLQSATEVYRSTHLPSRSLSAKLNISSASRGSTGVGSSWQVELFEFV